MTQFAIGQRWLSENETELGLGIIERVDHRLVGVFFPASEEQRTYAKDNAPLVRVVYEAGDKIETQHGDLLRVEEVIPHNDTLVYMVKADADADADAETKANAKIKIGPSLNKNKLTPLPETQLSHHLKLEQASDRLFSGQIDSLKWFELRYSAMKAKEKQQSSAIIGLQGPRVELIGHQLHIASIVSKRFAPRVLLSDEVGLGKTIEAGLIIHQQLISQRAFRVLIVVPQSLIHQWFVEMFRRFNLHFNIFDRSRIESLTELDQQTIDLLDLDQKTLQQSLQAENPYLSEQLILCSNEFIVECDIDAIANAEWDLVVVDEAHHLEWLPEKPSNEYQRIEKIANKTAGLLLLSATPEQLGKEGHFARLKLLDPNRFYDLNAFIAEQQQYLPIAKLVEQLTEQAVWEPPLKDQISCHIKDCEINESNRSTILAALLDRSGTGRVIYRNTRKNIKGFPKRLLIAYPLENCKEYKEYPPPLSHLSENHSATISQLVYPETRFKDGSWCQFDPRMEWLKDFIKQHRQQKIVAICAHKETAILFDLHCRFKFGINCCTFHEDLDLISRDRAAAHFADMEDGGQIIFCSEIGSEGRNFQFSHHLILLDLPLNPDLLEQRIGRLDRIGQLQDIQIHLPYIKNTAQQVLFDWYHRGMQAFKKTNAVGEKILSLDRKKLTDTLLNYDDKKKHQKLIEVTKKLTRQLSKELDEGKDKLLEMVSFDLENANFLIEQINNMDKKPPQDFIQKAWECFAVEYEDHSEKAYIVRPGSHMYVASFPSLPEEGITVTYDRKTALSRDDIHFLTWEHPMITGTIDLILAENKGNASICLLNNKAVKTGTLLVESLYKIECLAPKYLQAQRFLPYNCLRLLTDINGSDLAEKVSHHQLSQQCSKLDKRNARLLIKSEQKQLKTILNKAGSLAKKQANKILENVVDEMKKFQQNEVDRLISLKKTNPNVREEEIVFIQKQTTLLEKHINATYLQLEAVRVIVAS